MQISPEHHAQPYGWFITDFMVQEIRPELYGRTSVVQVPMWTSTNYYLP